MTPLDARRRPVRLTYVVSHPIQYQVPLLRLLSAEPGIRLHVVFLSDISVRRFHDPGFGRSVAWDVPLLGGYEHSFLDRLDSGKTLGRFRPVTVGIEEALEAERPDLVWIHGYAHYAMWRVIAWASRERIPVLLRGESHLRRRKFSRRNRLRAAFLTRWLQSFEAFLAIGAWNRQFYEEHGVGPERIFEVPYAVDNEWFALRAREAEADAGKLRRELGLWESRPVILFASKLQRRKRVLDLLEAYTRLSPDGKREPEPYLVVVGDGEERQELERRTAALGWSTVKLMGFRNQTELPAWYSMADGVVLPSDEEPWGLVVNEAMASSRAVVVSDRVGASADLVRTGENGEVFPVGDVEALASALRRVFSSRQAAAAMGQMGKKIIDCWSFREDVEGIVAAGHFAIGRSRGGSCAG